MLRLHLITMLMTSIAAFSHHLVVGTTDGAALYSLELDDEARFISMIQARDAAGAASSLVLDVCLSSESY